MKSILLTLRQGFCFFQINRKISTFHKDKTFLTDQYSKFSFQSLDQLSNRLSNQLLKSVGHDLDHFDGENIGVFCNNNYTYLISLLAIWRLKGTPMCLSKLYPPNYLDYFLTDSKCKLIINGFNSSVDHPSADLESFANSKRIVNFHLIENEFYKQNKSILIGSSSNKDIFQLQDFKESNKDALLLCKLCFYFRILMP